MKPRISTNRIGIISFKSTSHCGVMFDGQEIMCQIAKNVKIDGERNATKKQNTFTGRGLENQIVVGDRVSVMFDSSDVAIITERFSRDNQISRRSSSTRVGGQLIEQVLVSNIDQVIAVMAAANPEPKWNLLDRYLVMAEGAELPVSILITKTDLVGTGERLNGLRQRLAVYQEIGYQVF
ncbi:MAG TPA: GTPase RsgA, partial [Anaerolineaceae bacterium]|nr:GTPase RsgA [Anaerolineaceae bacterium]